MIRCPRIRQRAGFLLLCLSEWAEVGLVPYGIDINATALEDARQLFPAHAEHFIQRSAEDVSSFSEYDLPRQYDYIIWNCWQRLDSVAAAVLANVLCAMSERVIIAFYGSSVDPIGSPAQLGERKLIVERALRLRRTLRFGTVVENSSGGSQALLVCGT